MTTLNPTSTPSISTYLSESLRLGAPDVAGPLAVFPVFGSDPRLHYLSFADARKLGVAITELGGAASVNDLMVENPADCPVLLYECEEVLGAQQNRTFDVTVLVAAGTKLKVPVSCVEAGRWDHSRHAEDFDVAPQTAYPELRRAKGRHVRERLAAGLEARAVQAEVWHEIDLKAARHEARSPTSAMHDVYEASRGKLAELSGAIKRREGQLGTLLAIGGRFAVLDFVSRANVFAALHGPLVQGYALDALEADEAGPPSIEDARGFLSLVVGCPAAERRALGVGRDLRFAADGVAGSGLRADSELIQLTAFPDDGSAADSAHLARVGRIRRPSRRAA